MQYVLYETYCIFANQKIIYEDDELETDKINNEKYFFKCVHCGQKLRLFYNDSIKYLNHILCYHYIMIKFNHFCYYFLIPVCDIFVDKYGSNYNSNHQSSPK